MAGAGAGLMVDVHRAAAARRSVSKPNTGVNSLQACPFRLRVVHDVDDQEDSAAHNDAW